MDFGQINPILLIASLMVAATPILLAAIGEAVVEKAGVLNLGVEGMMITGAVVGGFAIGVNSGSPALGFVGAAIAGAALSMLFGVLVLFLLSNQVATGLGLTLFGLGLSSLIGKPYEGMKVPTLAKWDIPLLSDIPVLGPILFNHDPMVYVSLILVAVVWYVLKSTRAGLVLRAVGGENHDAAHQLGGYKVIRVRMMAIGFGGACAGLGGVHFPRARPAVGRGHDGRCGLDRAGDCRLRLLAALAGAAGSVPVWRYNRVAAEPAGRWRGHPGRIPVDEPPLCHHHPCAGRHLAQGQAWRAGLAGSYLPRIALRPA